MSSRGDSGYMSNYSSIYSQKSENSIDSYRDSYNDFNGVGDYVDYKSSSPSSPSYYSDQRDENIENDGNNRNYKKPGSLYPPSNQQYQYSTSPTISTSPTSYDSDQNELSPLESNKKYLPPNSSPNWQPYSLPSSPRYGPGPPIKMPTQQFHKNNNGLGIPKRDASLKSNPQQLKFPTLPRSPKIQIPITSEINDSPQQLKFSKSPRSSQAESSKSPEINNSPQQSRFSRSPKISQVESPKSPEISNSPQQSISPKIPQVESPKSPEISNSPQQSRSPKIFQVESPKSPEISNSPQQSRSPKIFQVESPKSPEISNSPQQSRSPKIFQVESPKTPEISNDQREPYQIADFDFFETHDIIDSYYTDITDIENIEPVKPVLIRADSTTGNRNREAAVNEILTTERTYVDGLKKVVNSYLLPLRENNQRSTNKILSTRPIATSEEISALFGNIEQILTLHEQLLKSLEERSPTQHISEIFLRNAPYLKMYIIYLKNFPQAISTMERLNKESKDFKKFLQQRQQKSDLGGLSFNSFLSLPIQRIPRYKLLMEAILKYTEESAPDYKNLKNCADQISAIAEDVNERIRDAENQQKVLEIQGKVTGLLNNIVDPARRFIHKGNLYKVTPSKNQPFYYLTSQDERDERAHFLFNDLLLFCLDFQGIYHYKGEIDLRNAKVIDIKDDYADRPYCFQIITRDGTHTVRAKSEEDKVEWVTKLEEAIWSLQNGRLASNIDGKRLIPIRQNS